MCHRKTVHPSNKKCRNYPGDCPFGEECWYVHNDELENVKNAGMFKCNLCDDTFKGRYNFLSHRKNVHIENVTVCPKFLQKECKRSPDDCWFEHPVNIAVNLNKENIYEKQASKSSDTLVFCEAPRNTVPPDQEKSLLEMIKQLCNKVELIEVKLKSILN